MKESLIDYKERVEYQIRMGIKNCLHKKEIISRMQTEGLTVSEFLYNKILNKVVISMMQRNKK